MVGAVTSNQISVVQEQAARLRKVTLAENLIATQYEILAQRTHQLERELASHTNADQPHAPARSGPKVYKVVRSKAAKAG